MNTLLDNKTGSILYLSYDGMTDPLGQSQVLPYMTGLSGKGYSISLISFEKRKTGYLFRATERILKEHKIKWIPLQYHKYPPVFSTLYDLFILKRQVKKIFYSGNLSIIHCRSYITSLVGLKYKFKYKKKFIFDMRGFWADERVDGVIWNLKNPVFNLIYKYFKKKEIKFIQQADHLIVLTENAKSEIENILKKNHMPVNVSNKVSVIPTCVDTDLFNRVNLNQHEASAIRNKLEINQNSFVLVYTGSLGTWYRLDEMLNFYKELITDFPDAIFLVLTPDYSILKDHLLKTGYIGKRQLPVISNYSIAENSFPVYTYSELKNIRGGRIILTSSYKSYIPIFLSLASLSICFIKPSYSKKGSSATKVFESLAMGVPVISNKGWGDIERIITDNRLGYIAENFSKEEYVKIVRKFKIRSKEEGWEMSDLLPDFASLNAGIESYQKIYDILFSTGPPMPLPDLI